MTQKQFADKPTITNSVVSYYKSSKRTLSPKVMRDQATIFIVSTDYLFGIERSKTTDVSDLSDDEIKLLLITIETLRNKKR